MPCGNQTGTTGTKYIALQGRTGPNEVVREDFERVTKVPKPKPRRAAQSRHRSGLKRVRLDDNSVEALKEQEVAFREKFDREPGPDPIFFDLDTDTPQPIREAHFVASTVKAMGEAGIDPSVIYPFKKTGMLVTEENLDKWSQQDLDEWNAALQEFEVAPREDH